MLLNNILKINNLRKTVSSENSFRKNIKFYYVPPSYFKQIKLTDKRGIGKRLNKLLRKIDFNSFKINENKSKIAEHTKFCAVIYEEEEENLKKALEMINKKKKGKLYTSMDVLNQIVYDDYHSGE